MNSAIFLSSNRTLSLRGRRYYKQGGATISISGRHIYGNHHYHNLLITMWPSEKMVIVWWWLGSLESSSLVYFSHRGAVQLSATEWLFQLFTAYHHLWSSLHQYCGRWRCWCGSERDYYQRPMAKNVARQIEQYKFLTNKKTNPKTNCWGRESMTFDILRWWRWWRWWRKRWWRWQRWW